MGKPLCIPDISENAWSNRNKMKVSEFLGGLLLCGAARKNIANVRMAVPVCTRKSLKYQLSTRKRGIAVCSDDNHQRFARGAPGLGASGSQV